jgi:hypothetical protein
MTDFSVFLNLDCMRLLDIGSAQIAFGACALLTTIVIFLTIRWMREINKIRNKNSP